MSLAKRLSQPGGCRGRNLQSGGRPFFDAGLVLSFFFWGGGVGSRYRFGISISELVEFKAWGSMFSELTFGLAWARFLVFRGLGSRRGGGGVRVLLSLKLGQCQERSEDDTSAGLCSEAP